MLQLAIIPNKKLVVTTIKNCLMPAITLENIPRRFKIEVARSLIVTQTERRNLCLSLFHAYSMHSAPFEMLIVRFIDSNFIKSLHC